MPLTLTIDLDDDLVTALDQMISGQYQPMRGELTVSRELAAGAALREWLIAAGYLPSYELDEDTPTEGEA